MVSIDYEKIGQKLKEGRESHSYTQKYICDILGVTPQTVSAWENGKNKIDIEILARLCQMYDISFAELVQSCFVPKLVEKDGDVLTFRDRKHIKKYQSLNETGKDDVDKYTDYILNNEANRRKQIQEVGKKGERECEVTSLQDESGNEDIVRVAVYDSDGKIVGYDLVTREVYEKLGQLGFTVGQERALRIAQPTNTEVGLAIEDYLKDQEDEQ